MHKLNFDFDQFHENNSNVYTNLNIKQSCILLKQIVPVVAPFSLQIDSNNFFWKQPIILFPKLDDF